MKRFTDKQRVERGIALLDRVGPDGWREKITEPLEMNNTFTCVLGQVYGAYWRAVEDPWGDSPGLKTATQGGKLSPGYGFNLYYEEDTWRDDRISLEYTERRWEELTAEWYRQLGIERPTEEMTT